MNQSHRSRIFTINHLILLIVISFFMWIGINPTYAKAQSLVEDKSIKVVLQQEYLDGELSEEIINELALSNQDIKSKYSEWYLIEQKSNKLVFHRKVDDISPLLKSNGYFGLTGDGILSTFNGKPDTSEVIQSFFQIDIKKLESHKHDELRKGIRIQSRDQYFEVIKSFESYSKAERK